MCSILHTVHVAEVAAQQCHVALLSFVMSTRPDQVLARHIQVQMVVSRTASSGSVCNILTVAHKQLGPHQEGPRLLPAFALLPLCLLKPKKEKPLNFS